MEDEKGVNKVVMGKTADNVEIVVTEKKGLVKTMKENGKNIVKGVGLVLLGGLLGYGASKIGSRRSDDDYDDPYVNVEIRDDVKPKEDCEV